MATMSRSLEQTPQATASSSSSETDLINDLISQNSQLSQEVIDLRSQLAQVRGREIIDIVVNNLSMNARPMPEVHRLCPRPQLPSRALTSSLLLWVY